jgi:outer membrane protein OmpA-like peptidoglycan-associated protein
MKTIAIFFRNLTLVLAVCSVSVAYSQSSLQKAQELKNNYEYQKAIDEYTKYFSTNIATSEDMRELVECYNMVNDLVSAETWLKKIIFSGDYLACDLWNYASALKSEAKYDDAIDVFKDYASMNESCKLKAAVQIEGCTLALQWLDDPGYFDVANEENLNSANSEFGLIKFGSKYILTSDRKTGSSSENAIYGWTGKPYLKLYTASKTGNAFAVTGPLDEGGFSKINALNNNYHNGPGIFDVSNSNFIFTRTKMVKVTKTENPDPTSWVEKSTTSDYVNRLEMFVSDYTYNVWLPPVAFEYNNAEEYSVGHPAVTSDGKILYFVSDMPGGYGSTDIYFCEKLSNGKWSEPQNAGSVINTDGKEVFPYVDDEGTLFFSSDGHAGMGGLDIFKSAGSKDSWSEPENMKCPINSSKDDFSIYFTETNCYGFLASNRDGGVGDDDIYSFEYAPPKSLILAVVTKEKLQDNSIIEFPGIDLKLTNISEESVESYVSDKTGHLYVDLDCPAFYELKGIKDGYFSQSQSIETKCKTRHDTIFAELVFEKIVINKPIVLQNIYYDFDKWFIRPDAAKELDKLVSILKLNPEINIELGSHCDSRGTLAYNDVLSQKRAESAVDYIISKGIDVARITAKGYGKRVLVNNCTDEVKCTEAQHQMNRRTEFKVTSIKKN